METFLCYWGNFFQNLRSLPKKKVISITAFQWLDQVDGMVAQIDPTIRKKIWPLFHTASQILSLSVISLGPHRQQTPTAIIITQVGTIKLNNGHFH